MVLNINKNKLLLNLRVFDTSEGKAELLFTCRGGNGVVNFSTQCVAGDNARS